MIALIVVALGAVAAAVGTGVLAARAAQTPRVYVIAWAIALFGLAVAMAAATLGFLVGYGALIFRAVELGVAMIAPLFLCLTLVEITGQRLASRFAMRLATAGIGVIALVILGSDPIDPNATFSTSWPNPADFYQLAPQGVLGFIALFTAVTAVAALAVGLRRSSREDLPREETRPGVILAVAALIVVLPGLAAVLKSAAGVKLPLSPQDLFAVTAFVAACLGWYAAKAAGRADLGQATAPGGRRAGDDRDGGYRGYETGEFDYAGGDRYRAGRHGDTFGDDRFGDDRFGDDRFGDEGPPQRRYDEPDSEIRYPALAALAADPAGSAEPPGLYRDEPGRFDEPFDDRGRGGRDDENGWHDGWDEHGDERGESHGDLFGQITIYTLIEGRVDEFDRLTERVVEQVRAKEPGTLVYIVHAVPTAPLQRILYEVYRDRTAHEDHLRRSYVLTYEADQRPFVLATNVIELGLQQAKVSPLPSMSAISDILSESGIDLTGVTGSAQRGFSRPDHRRPGQQQRPEYGRRPEYQQRPDFQQRPERPERPDHPQRPDYPQGPGYEPPYQGWAEVRGEDSRY